MEVLTPPKTRQNKRTLNLSKIVNVKHPISSDLYFF